MFAKSPTIYPDTNNSTIRSSIINTDQLIASSITTDTITADSVIADTLTTNHLLINNDSSVYIKTNRIETVFNRFDNFGNICISGDGNTIAVGVGSGSGFIYIYVKSGSSWTQQAIVEATDNVGLSVGFSVSLSFDGSTLASGAIGNPDSAVFVFTRTDGIWTQQAKLMGGGAQGCSVSLSSDGSTLAAGFNNYSEGNGGVWIFTRTAGVWTQQGPILSAFTEWSFCNQGWAVSLSSDGSTLAFSGIGEDFFTGAVWIFTRTAGVWTQGPKLVGTGSIGQSQQGYSISLSSDATTLAVGGNQDDNNIGAVWIFVKTNGVWSQQGPKLIGTGYIGNPEQGISVSLSDNVLSVGGAIDDGAIGATWIYTRDNGIWTQQGSKIVPTDYTGNPLYGFFVYTNSNTMIIYGKFFVDVYYLADSFSLSVDQAYISNLTTDVVNVTDSLSVANLTVSNLMTYKNELYGYRIGSSAQTLADNTNILLDSYWVSGSSDNTSLTYSGGLFTVLQNCYVMVTVSLAFAQNASGSRTCYISKNETTPYYGYTTVRAVTDDVTGMNCSSIIQCSSGDTVGVYVKQTSGGDLDTEISIPCVFSIIYLSNPI